MTTKRSLETKPRVDLVIPVFNEEDAIAEFHQQLRESIDSLPYHFAICYVNDGSSDRTTEKLQTLAISDPRVVVIELSRNFGHQAALTAGIDQSNGDYLISMDGDGQHPPQMIAEMLRLAESGYDIVLTQRVEEEKLSIFKRWTSALFYSLINRMGDTEILPGGADFRLLSKSVCKACNK